MPTTNSAAKKKTVSKKPAAKDPEGAANKENQSPAPVHLEALAGQIQAQGEKVRSLKEAKADKAAIGAEVKTLLDLKASYKAAAGKDWQPESAKTATACPAVPAAAASSSPAAPSSGNGGASAIHVKITAQGDLVRKLKGGKAAKAEVEAAVKTLLSLKQEYKAATGQDWKPDQAAAAVVANAPKVAQAAAPVKAPSPPATSGNGGGFHRMT